MAIALHVQLLHAKVEHLPISNHRDVSNSPREKAGELKQLQKAKK
jgi:hypothetical protein